jgi:hypothetical protein
VFLKVVNGILGLRPTLERLARKTWTDIAASRQLGVPMGETTLTDNNMLSLRSEQPSLVVYKHTAREEVLTGADWEWWLHTSDGWICLIFQAKLLSAEGKYEGITKGKTQGKAQIGALLVDCRCLILPKSWVEVAELDACVVGGELPVDLALVGVDLVLPGSELTVQEFDVA